MQEFIKSLLRIAQLVVVLLATALIGNVIATNGGHVETAAVNFIMFVCALSWVASIYGFLIHFVAALAMPIVSFALDAAASLFTLIGAIVLSAKLTAVNCANLEDKPDSFIAFGSDNDEKKCREIQASVVFLWLLFATFAVTLFFGFKEFRRGGGSLRSGAPTMSQIGV